MPEKVISGGFLVPSAAEVKVPTWADFQAAMAKISAAIKEINQNKQELWAAVNQFKRDPKADIHLEFRALRDAAFAAREQINGPRDNGEWTIWQCIGDHKARLDAIQSDAAKAFRAAIDETLDPLLKNGLEQAIQKVLAVENENKELKGELVALRAEIEELKNRIN